MILTSDQIKEIEQEAKSKIQLQYKDTFDLIETARHWQERVELNFKLGYAQGLREGRGQSYNDGYKDGTKDGRDS
jgi:flagellar biosynthesis/type III secretory pathway protein FliH